MLPLQYRLEVVPLNIAPFLRYFDAWAEPVLFHVPLGHWYTVFLCAFSMACLFRCACHYITPNTLPLAGLAWKMAFPFWVLTASAFSDCICLQVSVFGIATVVNCSWDILQLNTMQSDKQRTLLCFCKSVDFHKWIFSMGIFFSPRLCCIPYKRLQLFV